MSKNANNNQCQIPKRKVVFFATGNINKFNEARSILSQHGLAVGMLKLKGDEMQSESLKEIAEKSVKNAYRRCRLPIFVEDAGLFIDALERFSRSIRRLRLPHHPQQRHPKTHGKQGG